MRSRSRVKVTLIISSTRSRSRSYRAESRLQLGSRHVYLPNHHHHPFHMIPIRITCYPPRTSSNAEIARSGTHHTSLARLVAPKSIFTYATRISATDARRARQVQTMHRRASVRVKSEITRERKDARVHGLSPQKNGLSDLARKGSMLVSSHALLTAEL